jgi:hypothetical protein
MRPVLIIILTVISFSASAQWYRVDLKFKKKYPEHPPAIELVANHSIAKLPHDVIAHPKVSLPQFGRTDYSYEAAENVVMKQAQHNMRFRIYADASYNFSELAHLYIQQNRLSEAKWYLLQSNNISRDQRDDKHTILNLIDLATIKVVLGEYVLAQEDLVEAQDLTNTSGYKEYLAEIENMMLYIKQNKVPTTTPVLRYAETPQNTNKAE